jgi:hypothetical protein
MLETVPLFTSLLRHTRLIFNAIVRPIFVIKSVMYDRLLRDDRSRRYKSTHRHETKPHIIINTMKKKNNNILPPPFLAYSLMKLWLWLSFFFLIVPVVVVQGQIRCSRCSQATVRRTFPAWLCEFDNGDGYETPCGPRPCECTYFGGSAGVLSKDARFPYKCEILLQKDFPLGFLEKDSCSCVIDYDPVCSAEKCEYAYQCGDTLFVCWNVIDPQYLGLDLGSGSGSSFFTGLERIIHCDDFKHNTFQGDVMDGDPYCGGCLWGENLLPEDIVGKAICPNGQPVTRYIKFCTPPESVTTGVLTGGCDLTEGECDFGFCDYGDTPFTIIEYDETSRTASEPPAVASESPTCLDGYVRSIVPIRPATVSPTNAPIRPTNAPLSLRTKKPGKVEQEKKARVKKPKITKLKTRLKKKGNVFAKL